MPRFFCDAIAGGKAVITGEDAAHIARSLRMQPGERLTLSDGQGTDFDCVLDLVTPQEVFLTVLESYPCRTEPSVYVRLYMAMPKAEKLELIVQKAVELGVGEIIPVLTRRCVSRPDPKSFEKKRVRLARHCRRGLQAERTGPHSPGAGDDGPAPGFRGDGSPSRRHAVL